MDQMNKAIVIDNYPFNTQLHCVRNLWMTSNTTSHPAFFFNKRDCLSPIPIGKYRDKYSIIYILNKVKSSEHKNSENGRLYDPLLARCLSHNPVIQAPSNSQSYNRYSYCMNNPLIFTDPSGYVSSGYVQQQQADEARINGINNQLQWDSYNSFKALARFRDQFYFSGSGGGGNGVDIVSFIVSRDGSEYARHGDMGNIYSSYIYSGAGLNIVHSSRMTEVMKEFSSSLTSSQKDLAMSFGYDFSGEMCSLKGPSGKPKNAQQVFLRLLDMKIGESLEGGLINKELDGLTIFRYKDGFNLKVKLHWWSRPFAFKYDPDNLVTIDKGKWVDGTTDIIIYRQRYFGEWGCIYYIHNDAVKYARISGASPSPFNFSGYKQIGNGQW